MFSAISLLVLACAVTINAQALHCSETHIGNVPTFHAVKLETVNLAPLTPDWQVTIPPIPGCVYGQSGVHALMCDIDVPPTGYFTDFNHLIVHRNGNLLGAGTVTVTVYCNAKVQSLDDQPFL